MMAVTLQLTRQRVSMPLGFAHLGDSLVTGGNTSWPVGVDREVLGTGRGLPWNQLKAVTQPGETPETGVGASVSDKQLGHVRAAAGGGSRWLPVAHGPCPISAEGERAARRVPPPEPGALPTKGIFFVCLAEPEDGANFRTFGPDSAWVMCDIFVFPFSSFHFISNTPSLGASGLQPDRAWRQIVRERINEDKIKSPVFLNGSKRHCFLLALMGIKFLSRNVRKFQRSVQQR